MVSFGGYVYGALTAAVLLLSLSGPAKADIYSDVSASLKDPAPQQITNGNSKFGTFEANKYPKYLTNNPMPGGYPWGHRTARKSNPYKDAPYTGVTRRYNFDVARANLAPDGVMTEMIVVNGQFPGPTIEANWGDWIEVTVNNELDEGTALHWHGLTQKDTPWSDGVPSVHQCPIAPGASFTYRFRADLYGSSWWHAHYSSQFAAGVMGPMIIHGPNHLKPEDDYDVDLGPVFLTDWYHREYFSIVEQLITKNLTVIQQATIAENNLINGKMAFNCSMTEKECEPNACISKFQFTAGKKHLLRIINAGAQGQQKFSIDGHMLTVVAHDFVPIEPYTVPMISLGIGQRFDVVVHATHPRGSAHWMRSSIQSDCTPASQPHALAAIYYEKADRSVLPLNNPQPDILPNCSIANFPLELTKPTFKLTPAPEPDITWNIEMSFGPNATGYLQWMMNKSSFRGNFNSPILLLAHQGNFSYPTNWNTYNNGKAKTVRVIVKNNSRLPHPMHLHGHNFYELASGTGDWDGEIVNPENPSRRDTHIVSPFGHFVFQYDSINPGIWPFHCHVAWHNSLGLYINLISQPDDIQENMHIPEVMYQTCRDWAEYTNTTVVEQIDSGV